jgi:radical SAM superfamily enzyme YgiQ (UPF0313 family)
MRINLISVEDGINNLGFRHISSYVRRINNDTRVYYVIIGSSQSIVRRLLRPAHFEFPEEIVEDIASSVCECDVIGFSSMTHYSSLVARIIAAIRRNNPNVYVVWGGLHPIIEPEDAIKHADAVCTGEGEFAFEKLLNALRNKEDPSQTPGFWFKTSDGIRKNKNLPLMSSSEMDRLPIPTYDDGEQYYDFSRGFVPFTRSKFVEMNGLAYHTIWSIGCPFKCNYCGVSKLVEYDRDYRKIRHPSPAAIVAEIKSAITKQPHISSVTFHDDSFMALPTRTLKEFSELFSREIGLPFTVTGIIPNYVREDKVALLLSAGMNRVRMGIQSGSQAILDFYDRKTPVSKARDAAIAFNKFKQFMIPPAYDIILDNPIETQADTHATLDLLYELPRPFSLNLFSLRVIPNTGLEAAFRARGYEVENMRTNYYNIVPSMANILVYLIATFKLPGWLYFKLRSLSTPSYTSTKKYPALILLVRAVYLMKRGLGHLRFMDFSVTPGRSGYILWRLGVVRFWQRYLVPKYWEGTGGAVTVEDAAA